MGFLFFMLVPLFFFFLHPILFTNIPPILIEKKTMRIIQVLKKNAHRFHFRIFVLILQGINLSLLRDCNKHRVILQRQQARTIIRTRRRNKRSSKVVSERLNLKPQRHPHEIQPACVKRRLQRELLSNNHEHKHKHSNNKHNLYYFFKKNQNHYRSHTKHYPHKRVHTTLLIYYYINMMNFSKTFYKTFKRGMLLFITYGPMV